LPGYGNQPDAANVTDRVSEFPLAGHPQGRPAKKAADLNAMYVLSARKIVAKRFETPALGKSRRGKSNEGAR